ncbi:hypothetical protein C9374_001051 [Naegleria lovaniensis]|uniref:F-box domain-containing protein n=1 Tax=Naegleria lovaniensis TaxID=51637 RepID=A0AA88GTN1_NAELO|nr:uncharacterized protein C9374_001051 [Naegleria lovaniensis]KAG2388201.1 hypothetical protein C9374_001051 [Naegleria lovaniensis]
MSNDDDRAWSDHDSSSPCSDDDTDMNPKPRNEGTDDQPLPPELKVQPAMPFSYPNDTIPNHGSTNIGNNNNNIQLHDDDHRVDSNSSSSAQATTLLINNNNIPNYGSETNHAVVPIPIPVHQQRSQSTWDHDELMKGWIVKYTYSNVPPEVLVEIFKFLDISSLSMCSLVSQSWYYATLHDALWEPSVRKLFYNFNDQEGNFYTIDVGRMNKRYGKPIPPPPRPKKIEDYVTIENGKIISYHTLRALNIEQGKKKLDSKLRRDRKEYLRAKMQEHYENMNSLRYRYFFGFATLVYISLFLFLCMVAVKDAIPTDVIPNWHQYSFIPLWFFFIFGFGQIFFVAYMYGNARDVQILMMCGILLLVLLGGLSSAILSFLNLAVLPATYNFVTRAWEYTISWFIILIPAYIFILVMFIGMIVIVGIVTIEDWSNHQPWKKSLRHFATSMYFSTLNMFMICAVIMIGFTLEYPTYFATFWPGILALIVSFGFVLTTARFLWKERKNEYSSDRYIMSFGLIFFICLCINIIVVGLYPFLLSYSWFSSLLPLTAAYAFVCRIIYEG